ncbi:MAG: aspartate kinase [Bacteroidota bacterium]
MTPLPIKVMKFGGTSVGTIDRVQHLVNLVQAAVGTHRVVVVASALSGVTDTLVALIESRTWTERVQYLKWMHERHRNFAVLLLHGALLRSYLDELEAQLHVVRDRLAIHGDATLSPQMHDEVLAMGERLSVPLMARLLGKAGVTAQPVDATRLICTDATYQNATVDVGTTYRQVTAWYDALPGGLVPVVTGFLGATADGHPTTLGRGGSDYSAALLAAALDAEVLERWTDTNGIYTADPRLHPDAKRIATIVLREAAAWNHAGRIGMHRKALDPLVTAGIPVHVRSTREPAKPGTQILPSGVKALPLAS